MAAPRLPTSGWSSACAITSITASGLPTTTGLARAPAGKGIRGPSCRPGSVAAPAGARATRVAQAQPEAAPARAQERAGREQRPDSPGREPVPPAGKSPTPEWACRRIRRQVAAQQGPGQEQRAAIWVQPPITFIRLGYNAYQALNEPNPPILPPQLSSCARSPPATHPIAPVTLPSPHGAAGQALP